MYERILLPTDGSEGTDRAVEQAIGLAAETGAELHALFVVEDAPYAPEMTDERVSAQLREIGENAIASIRDRADAADVTVRAAIEDGIPNREILKYADGADVDLVVMGTHSRSGLDKYLLGSVTERVVRTADVPVLTVRVDGD
ncbi:universal stress protein [Natronomonas sp. F2-12]|jgi:nucleotide-binding universal stress UspA family protein|uniref:Universal stress protein n=1 Tax=Natronomonas aquatica TaxID=2841590 RepID=A0A9R1CUQ5_9EURY|nr:universal stress protein [Natronomonas aquatica]MCQ4333901.1 universal stress protein [Natronomonas aquatica]